MVELLCVCLLVSTVTGIAVPQTLGIVSRSRTLAAARYLAARMQSARAQAASRSTHVGIRVAVLGRDVHIGLFRDGNRNGLRTAEMVSGVDPQVEATVGIGDLFPGVQVGAADGAPPPPVADEDVTTYSFGPSGTASSGTVYLRSEAAQYAVRVLGATGRVRLLRFRPASGDWVDVR